ncbi:hypothetical protein [Streptosporangium sp. NPDC006007]|uniref:hypothetical protein n=1 Tax=Streptosporangium sp. NPDC006007 TaxID=3154575 RepID=UPI0033BA7C7D
MRASTLEGWGGYLVRLAWELDEFGFDATVRFPLGGRPSLVVFAPSGRTTIRSARRGRTSAFTWDRGRSPNTPAEAREVFRWIAEVAR